MNDKILIFEGAGSNNADTDVGNYRIRTRMRNNLGRVIYLELSQVTKGNLCTTCIAHCFYDDSKWDARRNHSDNLRYKNVTDKEYSKQSILQFVNTELNCSFESMSVYSDGSVRVFDTKEPLCNCANSDGIPYEDEKINISMLDNIHPRRRHSNYAQYEVSYRFFKKHFKSYIESLHEDIALKIKNSIIYAAFRWDDDGYIFSADISGNDISYFSIGLETAKSAIDEISRNKKKKQS